MTTDAIYLDHNATTPQFSEVAQAVAACARDHFANPASQHEPGRQARRELEQAREQIATLLGASTAGMHADRVIFTSGATEANNLALRGLAGKPPARIIVSAIEHPSVLGTAQAMAHQGFDVQYLPTNANGLVDAGALENLITPETRLVSVMLGNNETGALQPVLQLAKQCRKAGVLIHTDATQVAGKLDVDFTALGVTALTLSAHKFHGPRGAGAMILQSDVHIEPILYGGFQQSGIRPGTEPVAPFVGMAVALQIWDSRRAELVAKLTSLRDQLESQLTDNWPELVVHARQVDRLPHTSNISFPGIDRQAFHMALDLAGVACSTGSACASGSSDPSHVLSAMGCEKTLLHSALRFSVGALTTAAEVDLAAQRILAAGRHLQQGSEPRNSAGPPPKLASKRV